jgi:hypothetical protein
VFRPPLAILSVPWEIRVLPSAASEVTCVQPYKDGSSQNCTINLAHCFVIGLMSREYNFYSFYPLVVRYVPCYIFLDTLSCIF